MPDQNDSVISGPDDAAVASAMQALQGGGPVGSAVAPADEQSAAIVPAQIPRAVENEQPTGLQIDVPQIQYRRDPRKTLWAGVVGDCPVDHVACGGITFQKYTISQGGITHQQLGLGENTGAPRPGCVVRLADHELEFVLKSMARIGINIVNDPDTGEAMRAAVDVLSPGMIPAACYCWLAEVDEGADIGRLKIPNTLTPLSATR